MSPSAAGSETREMAERPSERFLSGDALFVFDADLTIVSWNPAAEELTGVSGEEAVGQNCWEVLGGHDERGNLVCHSGCATARLAREGWPVSHQCLLVNGREGKRRVDVSTLAMDDGDRPLFVHVLVPCSEAARPRAAASSLTPRQLEYSGSSPTAIRPRSSPHVSASPRTLSETTSGRSSVPSKVTPSLRPSRRLAACNTSSTPEPRLRPPELIHGVGSRDGCAHERTKRGRKSAEGCASAHFRKQRLL
jgi:PAS domain S-box-containing protein